METGMCRIEVNRFDGRGWRQWGCGREWEPALADRLIDGMRPDPERRAAEAAGLAVPSKLFRKVPVETGGEAVHGPRHYYEIRDPSGKRLGYGLIPESDIAAGAGVALLARYPAGSTFRSEAVTEDEARTVIETLIPDNEREATYGG